MLMLYTTEEKTPETLQAVPHIISNSTVYPIALTPLTAEDQVIFTILPGFASLKPAKFRR